MNKIVLAGGSGYLGCVIAEYFKEKLEDRNGKKGEIVILSRKKHPSNSVIRYCKWDGKNPGDWVKELEAADLLINLSGKNVNCRYTEKNKNEIFSSRLEPTALLGNVIGNLKQPPRVWINLASATIYRHAEDHYQDEKAGEIGSGFSVEVCKAWEKTFLQAETPQTKKIILRTSIVLGRKDGMLPRVINLVRTGMGGHQGNGRQYISWIHEQDMVRIIEWAFENAKDGDIYNCAAPEAISNKEFMKIVREYYGIPIGLPSPAWMLEIGAWLIGTETELLLKSRWVHPGNLLANGFRFYFPFAKPAIVKLLDKKDQSR